MSKHTGGPAFPELGNVAHNSDWQSESGMTLRDWFAGQALPAMLAEAYRDEDLRMGNAGADVYHAIAAAASYRIADAMLSERSKSDRSGS